MLPIAEATLPGENSLAFLRLNGWPMWTAALISILEGITTTAAQALIDAGRVTVDGRAVRAAQEHVRENSLIEVQGGGIYRLGHPGPDAYGGSR
jgi:hypothetical protein